MCELRGVFQRKRQSFWNSKSWKNTKNKHPSGRFIKTRQTFWIQFLRKLDIVLTSLTSLPWKKPKKKSFILTLLTQSSLQTNNPSGILCENPKSLTPGCKRKFAHISGQKHLIKKGLVTWLSADLHISVIVCQLFLKKCKTDVKRTFWFWYLWPV